MEVFLDASDDEDAEDEDDIGDVWMDALEDPVGNDDMEPNEAPLEPPKPLPRFWSYEFKRHAVYDTFNVLKNIAWGAIKYGVPQYYLERWKNRMDMLGITEPDYGSGTGLVPQQQRNMLSKKTLHKGRDGLNDADSEALLTFYNAHIATGTRVSRRTLARALYHIQHPNH